MKTDMAALTVEERLRKAAELLDLIKVVTSPRPPPPPLVYRPEEAPDDNTEATQDQIACPFCGMSDSRSERRTAVITHGAEGMVRRFL